MVFQSEKIKMTFKNRFSFRRQGLLGLAPGLIIMVLALCSSSQAFAITVTQVVNRTHGLDAILITIPEKQNIDFSILDVPQKKDGDSIRSHWNPTNQVLIVNGGFFNADFTPTGMCKIDEEWINKRPSRGFSGFIAIDKKGRLKVLTRTDNLNDYPTLMQSGPYVIDPGRKIGIHSRIGRETRRTLVGKTKAGDLVILITKPIYLYDLAKAVHETLPTLDRLLNLDGGPSTGIIYGTVEELNTWPVRNYIVKAKTP